MNRSSSILIIAYALFFLTACINDKIPVNTNIHEDKTSDTLAPNVISVEINNGDKNTNSRNLLINIVAKDDTAVASFCISESETLPLDADNWINIETPNNELDLTVDYFTEVDGVGLHAKTIYVWLRDSAGNISQVNSASISIDIEDTQPPPATVSISIEEGAVETNHAQVSISLILEDSKKVTAYYISESSTNPKPNSTNWRSLPNTNLNNININYNLTPAVVPGEYQRIIYAWLLDENGNISEVGSSSIKLVIEDNLPPLPPHITIANNDSSTNQTNIQVSISSSDSDVVEYYLSESNIDPDANEINWQTFPISNLLTSFNLNGAPMAGEYERTLYAWLRDSAGNISGNGYDSITLIITDTSSPDSVNVVLNDGAGRTNSNEITLSLFATDDVGVSGYYVSESPLTPDTNNQRWSNIAPNESLSLFNIPFLLSAENEIGEHQKEVYVWFKDSSGNISNHAKDSIILNVTDTDAPTISSVEINQGDETTSDVDISLSVSSSDNAGISGYYISENLVTPTLNSPGWLDSVENQINATHVLSNETSIGQHEKFVYVWSRDTAGNISSPGVDSITLLVNDIEPPQSAMALINQGAEITSDTNITISISASDNEGISAYYISEILSTPSQNTPGWTLSTLNSIDTSYTLSAETEIGTHEKTIYVWFRDAAGNISTVTSDSINLSVTDTDAPTISSVEINQGDETTSDVDISLSVSSSDNAGISGYYISENLVTPTLNSPGWLNSVENQINATHVLSNETSIGQHEKFVYVWSRDTAGNISSPGVDSITLLVNDIEPPQSATALINQGAEITSDTNITISISASDNEGISAYYISEILSTPSQNTPGWTLSTLNSIDTSYTLSAETEIGTHEKTIYVWFRDAAGNISTVASDSINLSVNDTSPPNNTSIDAAGNTTETTQRLVAVNIAALDNYAVTHYFLSENPTTPALNAMWTSITPTADFSTTVSFELSDNFGSKTVYAWFKDAAGNISSSTQYTINYISDVTPIAPGTSWLFLGDSQTAGRTVNEPAAHSHGIAFQNIWNQTFISEQPDSVRTSGVGGRVLQKTHEKYLDMNFGTETWVHFQESGLQNSTQDTIVEYINEFEAMVRSIAQESPSAIISTETAYSFEEIVAERNWTDHNIAMRQSITGLANEGITVYLSEVDRNIKELISRKRAELGEKLGQEAVWGDTNNTIGRHYTGLGNVMIALSIYDALGYDLSILDFSLIPEQQVSNADILLCIDIINNI